jgi:hypothetical protein
MVPIKVCNAPQIFTRDLTGLPPNRVRFVILSDYLGMVGYHAKPHAPDQKKSPPKGAIRKRSVRHRINDIVQSACDAGIFGNAAGEREGRGIE